MGSQGSQRQLIKLTAFFFGGDSMDVSLSSDSQGDV